MEELTEEETEIYGNDIERMLVGKLPGEDEDILVTYNNGTVDADIFMKDGNECYLDSGNAFVTEAIAWKPLPEPYHLPTCGNSDCPYNSDNGCPAVECGCGGYEEE